MRRCLRKLQQQQRGQTPRPGVFNWNLQAAQNLPPQDLTHTTPDMGTATDLERDPGIHTRPNVQTRPTPSTVLNPATAKVVANGAATLHHWLDEGGLQKFVDDLMLAPPTPMSLQQAAAMVDAGMSPNELQNLPGLEDSGADQASTSALSAGLQELRAAYTAAAGILAIGAFEEAIEDLGQKVSALNPTVELQSIINKLENYAVIERNATLSRLKGVAVSVGGSGPTLSRLLVALDGLVRASTEDFVDTPRMQALWTHSTGSRNLRFTPFVTMYFAAVVAAVEGKEAEADATRDVTTAARLGNPAATKKEKADIATAVLSSEELREIIGSVAKEYLLGGPSRAHVDDNISTLAQFALKIGCHKLLNHATNYVGVRRLMQSRLSAWGTSMVLGKLATYSFITKVESNSFHRTDEQREMLLKEPLHRHVGAAGDTADGLRAERWSDPSVRSAVLEEWTQHAAVIQVLKKVMTDSEANKEQRAAIDEFWNDIERMRASGDAMLCGSVDSVIHDLNHVHIAEFFGEPLAAAFTDAALAKAKSPEFVEEEKKAKQSAAQRYASPVPVTIRSILAGIRSSHPAWVRSGVVPPATKQSAPCLEEDVRSTEALQLCFNMFCRVSYVPQQGQATLGSRYRQREGPVGLRPYHHNIPCQVGTVQHYDNMHYKQWDWQGWYQRMHDVNNRNVSLKLRLADLGKLRYDGERPFLSMQGERRLRVVAGDRVTTDVVKLDADKFEDQPDNLSFGSEKMQELVSEARKADLSSEYWPTVEMKLRRPSGHTMSYASVLDQERLDKKASELVKKYKALKAGSMEATPMMLWLQKTGEQQRTVAKTDDQSGYTVDDLQESLDSSDSNN